MIVGQQVRSSLDHNATQSTYMVESVDAVVGYS